MSEKGQTTPITIQGTEEVKTTKLEWVIPGFELDFNGTTLLVQPIEKKYNYQEALDLASKSGDDLPQEWRDHDDRVWSSSQGKAVNLGINGYGSADNVPPQNPSHVVLIKEKK